MSNPRKRARPNAEDDVCAELRNCYAVTSTPTTRDPEFWYPDGTIILVARAVEFRIYRGLLADHSPVFADMFSLPQPDGGLSITIEGEPSLVHIADSPEDLRHILRACMPRTSALFFPVHVDAEPVPFHVIFACARFGHKYQMEHLLNQCLLLLKRKYCHFDTWTNPHTVFDSAECIAVVKIARLTGCDVLLPSALALCACMGAEIVQGYKREDGSRDMLDLEDIGRCFAAKDHLTVMTDLAIQTISKSLRNRCKLGCDEAFRNGFTLLRNNSLFFLRNKLQWGLCGDCKDVVKVQAQYQRRKIWNRLPKLVQMEPVDGWQQLAEGQRQ